jgi:hypothetical protein
MADSWSGGGIIWSDEVCRIHEVPVGTAPTVEEAIAYFAPASRTRLRRLVDACLRDVRARLRRLPGLPVRTRVAGQGRGLGHLQAMTHPCLILS